VHAPGHLGLAQLLLGHGPFDLLGQGALDGDGVGLGEGWVLVNKY